MDTIVAIASPPGRGAVGIIRISGPEVPRVAVEILGSLPSARVALLARFRAGDGSALDEGLAVYFPAPASYTGEHVLELQGHGGTVVLDSLLQRLLTLGCRMARPGEFSERAFLNGKMDVVQAEAVADLIDAGTGEFSARIHQLQAHLTELRIYVEAAIDFPDEEIDFLTGTAMTGRIARVFEAFVEIQAAAKQGALLRDGLTVVIAGKPNAGKSSLLNRLVGDEVAIVTDRPGTTRDVLRQYVHVDGMPLNLVDTAGLRSAEDVVEEEGIRRARSEMQRADQLLYLIDASRADDLTLQSEMGELPSGVPVTLVVNKIDLLGQPARTVAGPTLTRIYVSARTGEGFDLLRSHLTSSAGYRGESGAVSARRRHLDALARAETLVRGAAATLQSTQAFELFAEDLRLAQRALGEITGEFTSEDLLGEIFGSFCIGK
jgi:tRNA modification GTPase